MTDHPDTDLTDHHGEAEALRRENARLRAEIAEATDPEFIWGALDNVHDAETTMDDYAAAVSRAQRAALAASRAPDPVVNAGSCQPADTIDSLFDQIRAIMDAAKDQADRYGHIAATIYVNALRHGATNADADAMVRGEINFISWMADVIEKRDRALPAAPVAEAQPDWKAMAEPDYCYNPEDWEYTQSWDARHELAESVLDYGRDKEPARVSTLISGPDKWVTRLPLDTDGDGEADDWEYRWFDSEEAARAALSDLAKMKGE